MRAGSLRSLPFSCSANGTGIVREGFCHSDSAARTHREPLQTNFCFGDKLRFGTLTNWDLQRCAIDRCLYLCGRSLVRDLLSRSRERSIPAHNRHKACCGLRVINASADNARRAERDLTRARGGGKLPTIDCHLTFTHHFRLRRSPHRGHMMRKRPLDSPRPHIVVFRWSCTPRMGLAGAYHFLTFPLFVGAPLA